MTISQSCTTQPWHFRKIQTVNYIPWYRKTLVFPLRDLDNGKASAQEIYNRSTHSITVPLSVRSMAASTISHLLLLHPLCHGCQHLASHSTSEDPFLSSSVKRELKIHGSPTLPGWIKMALKLPILRTLLRRLVLWLTGLIFLRTHLQFH